MKWIREKSGTFEVDQGKAGHIRSGSGKSQGYLTMVKEKQNQDLNPGFCGWKADILPLRQQCSRLKGPWKFIQLCRVFN